LRALCQGVIPVVASRSIGEQFATIDWNPVTAILHQHSPLFDALFIFDAQLDRCKT
jgi:hypothetical protein